jgi:hypothetical protein
MIRLEAATPFTVFEQAVFEVSYAAKEGKVPECDERMLRGWTGKLLIRGWAGKDGIEADPMQRERPPSRQAHEAVNHVGVAAQPFGRVHAPD